jgi:serine/threonine-protein phosphatase 6 regulatory ankyrin repeat subunit B
MSKCPFWQAIYKGDAPLSFLQSPLYIACQKGHLDIVLQLLDKKVNTDVNKCRKDSGASPLYIACQKGHLDIVLQLLDKKVNTTMSKCPSWQAINKGDVPSSLHLFTSVLTFLSNSCSTMSKCPSWQAINKGDAPLSKVNTDVNKCTDDGTSPLFIACQNGHLDIVLQLLDKKVNTDVNKCTDDGVNVLSGKQYIKVIHHCRNTCLHLY